MVEYLNMTLETYDMEISEVKTKLMANNTNSISTDIMDSDEKLETVHSFNYLGVISRVEVF